MKQKSYGNGNIQCGGNITINGNQIESNGTIISGRKVFVNGKEYDIPQHVNCNNQSMIDGKIYVGGWEFMDGEWKITLASLWHWVF